MLGDEADLSRGRPRRIAHQRAFDAPLLSKRGREPLARIILADETDEDAARAEGGDIARDIAGAADIDLAALGNDDRRRRFTSTYFHSDLDNPLDYDLILNTDRISVEEGASLIAHLVSSPKFRIGKAQKLRELRHHVLG